MNTKNTIKKALCILLICSQVAFGGVIAYAYDSESSGNPPLSARNIAPDKPR